MKSFLSIALFTLAASAAVVKRDDWKDIACPTVTAYVTDYVTQYKTETDYKTEYKTEYSTTEYKTTTAPASTITVYKTEYEDCSGKDSEWKTWR